MMIKYHWLCTNYSSEMDIWIDAVQYGTIISETSGLC